MPDDVPTPERVRVALDEVLGWQGISRSPQLAELLKYVVEKTLAGDSAAIKAYSIAVDVFGRSADFDPQTDPIVRVQARRLRGLLEQYHASGINRSGVEIRLPLGRYVPEFVTVDPTAPELKRRPANGSEGVRSISAFTSYAMLALIFTLVGVALAVALVRGMLPRPDGANTIPQVPAIAVGPVDNLTGQPELDGEINQVGSDLKAALGRFEGIRVAGEGAAVTATVQQLNGSLVLRATLVDGGSTPWTTTINVSPSKPEGEALHDAALALAAQLGSSAGPLHAAGRAWLDLQTSLPAQPTAYVCDLLYMRWRDSRRLADATRTGDCFDKIVADAPEDAVALAASADVSSWRTKYLAAPGDDLSQLLGAASGLAGRAVTLRPDSSFVYEQQATVLARQGSVDAAMGSIRRALELNPASMDAVAVEAMLLWRKGQFADAGREAERALSVLPVPPHWYYTTRALNALREDRFFDAIDAAQALAVGDDELGPIIALTAAPRAARADLIDRYRPIVLGNIRFQQSGIMPRLEMRVNATGVLQRIRAGLVLAGIPANTLDAPFNPDGSPKSPNG